MELTKLIYYSTACDHCDSSEIDKILETSRKINTQNGITGILYFSNNFFMQYLEGDKAYVEDTYVRISEDSRHKNIHLVDKSSIEKREFTDWAMAYIPESDLIKPLIMKHMNSAEFNPQRISADSAMPVVLELYSQLPAAYYEDTNA